MIKRILIATVMLFALVAVVQPVGVSALIDTNAAGEACEGVGLGTNGCDNNPNTLNNIVTTVVNLLSVLVGLAAVIMIIVGGFKYITSGGDSSKAGTAKNTIVYAVIGLVIVALAQFVVWFVLDKTK